MIICYDLQTSESLHRFLSHANQFMMQNQQHTAVVSQCRWTNIMKSMNTHSLNQATKITSCRYEQKKRCVYCRFRVHGQSKSANIGMKVTSEWHFDASEHFSCENTSKYSKIPMRQRCSTRGAKGPQDQFQVIPSYVSWRPFFAPHIFIKSGSSTYFGVTKLAPQKTDWRPLL